MTLILSVGNAHQIVMVADRMLSRARTPTDPDANKLALLLCRDSRWAVGFSGLASLSSGGRTYFRTHQFIAEALADAAEPDHIGKSIIDRVATRLMDRFDQADAVGSGISLLFMGYQDIGQGVSDLTRRSLGARMARPVECHAAGAIASAIGETRAMDTAVLQELANKAAAGVPASGLRDYAAHIVRTAANSKLGRGVIGQKCASICVPINPSVDCSLDYLTDQPVSTRRYGNVIDCRKGGPGVVMTDYSFASFSLAADDLSHQIVQKVGRNDPCPCGSGKKYKRCHYLVGPETPERYEMLVRFQYRPGMTLTLPLPRKGGSEVIRPND